MYIHGILVRAGLLVEKRMVTARHTSSGGDGLNGLTWSASEMTLLPRPNISSSKPSCFYGRKLSQVPSVSGRPGDPHGSVHCQAVVRFAQLLVKCMSVVLVAN